MKQKAEGRGQKAEQPETTTREIMPPQSRTVFWIDVRDHLPDDEIEVLAYVGNGVIEIAATDSGFPDNSGNIWFRSGTLGHPLNVLFWADLPELPNLTMVQEGGAK